MDAVQQANSGHPGMPMGMADIAEVLWSDFLKHNPANPQLGRPRPLRAVERPRLDAAVRAAAPDRLPAAASRSCRTSASSASRTPGIPSTISPLGIETTTGPLGQGLANAVGMALAEKLLAAQFNRPGFKIVDHHTYVFLRRRLPDGGHLARGLLARRHAGPRQAHRASTTTTASPSTARSHGWFTDDTPKRFEAYGWHVVPNVDGHDAEAVAARDPAARARDRQPSADLLQDHHRLRRAQQAGHGGDATARRWAPRRSRGPQGARLGTRALRDPAGHYAPPGIARARGAARREPTGGKLFEALRAALIRSWRAEFERRMRGELPADWAQHVAGAAAAQAVGAGAAWRRAQVLAGVAQWLGAAAAGAARRLGRPHRLEQHLVQGRRAPSTRQDAAATTSHYGVREFGMTAIMNGIALHGGFIPYGGTFLVFSDYARNALRMAALMERRQHLRVHARLDRPGRGRPHPPAGRAPAPACALMPQHGAVAALRRRRDRGGLGARHRAPRRAHRAGADAPGPAAAAAQRRAAGGDPPRRLRAGRLRRARRSAS